MLVENIKNKTNIALVANWNFHKKDKWVSIFAPYFVEAFIKEFNPIIIRSQLEYMVFKNKLKYIVVMEPGWAAPKINYDKKLKHTICVFVSDPHNKKSWFQDYIIKNDITYVLSQYYSPFFYHFPTFPKKKFIYFPWAVPDQLAPKNNISLNGSDIMIFGGKASNAYDVRNWCREQKNIVSFENSGVENKKLSNKEFFGWLSTFDAIVAAGSSHPMYDLVTPKYFEIASVGALVIGQKCKDLELLGFNETNMLIFEKDEFNPKIEKYLKNPEVYLEKRKNGKKIILEEHLVSHRINFIKNLFNKEFF